MSAGYIVDDFFDPWLNDGLRDANKKPKLAITQGVTPKLTHLQKLQHLVEIKKNEVNHSLERLIIRNTPNKPNKPQDSFFTRMEKVVLSIFYFFLTMIPIYNWVLSIIVSIEIDGAIIFLSWIIAIILGLAGACILLILSTTLFTFVDWLVRGNNRKKFPKWLDIITEELFPKLLNPLSYYRDFYIYREKLELFQKEKSSYSELLTKCENLLEDLNRPDAEELFSSISIETMKGIIKASN